MDTRLEYIARCHKLQVVVLIPTYNNESTLLQVIEDAQQYCADVWVVNDGSTDGTFAILQELKEVHCIHFECNRGKGVALRQGMRSAFQAGFRYAITMDSDGQHTAKDIPAFLDALEQNPDSLCVGIRNFDAPNMPSKNSFANRFSNFWFQLQTAIKLADTQSGFRAYPLHRVHRYRFLSSRYEFELEMLVYSAWRKIPLVSVPITVYYAPEGLRVSHFRPGLDFLRITLLNIYLTLLALLWYRPLLLLRSLHPKNIKNTFAQLMKKDMSNRRLACSIALGGFFGIVPIWGYQMVAAAGVAHLLKLNKAVCLIASNVSVPPMIPFILYGSVVLGAWFLGEPFPSFNQSLSLDDVQMQLKNYLVGSVLLALAYGILSGVIAYVILSFFRKEKS